MTILEIISLFEEIRNTVVRKSKKITFTQHVVIVFFGIILSIIFYLSLFKRIHIHFENPPTTTISWFTVNNYPRQQDYFYFFSSFIFVLISTCLIWLLMVWKKPTK